MAATKNPIATDSATELHDLIGDDATGMFESNSKFIDSNPTENASSANIEVQRDTDDTEDSEEEIEEEDEEDGEESDSPETARVVDAALRMDALAAVAAELAVNV